MDARSLTNVLPGFTPDTLQALAADANAVALMKAYLAIPDEAVKKKLRRLAEEIAAPAKRAAKAS